jgi:hypothetical protein
LFTTIKINRAINIRDLPTNAEGPKSVLNSLCRVFITASNGKKFFCGVAQYKGEIIIIKIVALIQFSGAFIKDDGSKTENKLVIIIFILVYWDLGPQ